MLTFIRAATTKVVPSPEIVVVVDPGVDCAGEISRWTALVAADTASMRQMRNLGPQGFVDGTKRYYLECFPKS